MEDLNKFVTDNAFLVLVISALVGAMLSILAQDLKGLLLHIFARRSVRSLQYQIEGLEIKLGLAELYVDMPDHMTQRMLEAILLTLKSLSSLVGLSILTFYLANIISFSSTVMVIPMAFVYPTMRVNIIAVLDIYHLYKFDENRKKLQAKIDDLRSKLPLELQKMDDKPITEIVVSNPQD